MRDFIEFLGFMTVFILFVLSIFFAACCVGEYFYSPWRCASSGEIMNIETRYIAWDQCYAKIDGKFIPDYVALDIISNDYRVKLENASN